ncbi:TetR/AcrR family transcriptional regulator [Spirillospora sp. CA-255316]
MTRDPGWSQHIARHAVTPPKPGAFIGPRTKLLLAGQQLLFEHGDSSYTIEELVRRAGVAIKTFYRCFPNKEEFLQTVFTTFINGTIPMIRERILGSSDDPLVRLRMAVTWPLVGPREDGRMKHVIANEHVRIAATNPERIAETNRAYAELVRELVADASAAGLLHPSDLDWDVHIITSMITTSFHTLVLGLSDPPDRALLAENVWRFCLTALHGPRPVPAEGAPAEGAG